MFCPKCEVEMRQAVKEEVVIDVCPRCRGIWLDHGELEKIMHEAKHAMIEYDELHKYHDKHKHHDHHHGYKHYKKKHSLFKILEDIFD